MENSEMLKQFKEHFQFLTLQEIGNSYEEETAEVYFERFVEAFQRLFEKNEHLMPDAQAKWHAINPIFVLALHEALEPSNVSFEKLKEHVISIYRVMTSKLVEDYVAQIESSEDKWKTVVESTRYGNQQNYDNSYFGLTYVADNEREFSFDINKCFYFEIFEANGHPELGPILCEYDYILMDAIPNWVRFERTETIANGDTRCNFQLFRV